MISPNHLIVYKIVGKTTVLLVAVEIAAYEISPEHFSQIAVGVGAIVVAFVAVIGMFMNAISNRKTRLQVAQIARDQAAALALSDKSANHLQTLEIRMDGRMDNLLATTAEISEAIGVKKGIIKSEEDAAKRAGNVAQRDAIIVDKVSAAVVERIEGAADAAAKVVPGAGKK